MPAPQTATVENLKVPPHSIEAEQAVLAAGANGLRDVRQDGRVHHDDLGAAVRILDVVDLFTIFSTRIMNRDNVI